MRLRSLLTILALLLLVLTPSLAQESTPTLSLIAPASADSEFEIKIRTSNIDTFRGMEFILDISNNAATLSDAKGAGQLAGTSVVANVENGKVVVYAPEEILDVSGDIITLTLRALGGSGDSATIALQESLISDGQNVVEHTTEDTEIIISQCVDYPNTHTGEGQGIPGTTCACNEGTNLLISPSTQEFSCQLEDVEDLFHNAQDCSLGGDPIYNTGYCCKDGYQLNPQFNNFNDLLGDPTEACTLIPNQEPIANIFQPPETATVGVPASFSSLGSTDLDGTILSYFWDFGDTKSSNLQNSEHVYESISSCPTGVCTVTLTVKDDDGSSNSFSVIVSLVEDPNAVIPESVCGDLIIGTGEVCDSNNDAACEFGCSSTCICLDGPTSPSTGQTLELDVGETYDEDEADTMGISIDGETELGDGTVVTTNAAGTVTDLRTENSPPIAAACGNAQCEVGENAVTCLQDCHINDGVCQKELGETNARVPGDCKKSKAFLIIPLLILALIGGGAFISVRKGWISMGPIMHKDQQGPSGGITFDVNRLAAEHHVQRPTNQTDRIIDYIHSARGQGISFSQIKDGLLKNGWKESTIDAAFSRAG